MLLTRSPLYARPKASYSFDLHVLGAPPAFILSQDQTLRSKSALSGVRCEIVPVRLVIYPSSESTPSEEG